MVKTASIGRITAANVEFAANVVPDPFDARDLLYRPRLEVLQAMVDQRDQPGERYIMRQQGSSCTGHAVAAMVNTALARASTPPYARVSPYMLYYLGRRYDEFPGEADKGSSLRGVLKGWWHHGIALEADWPNLTTHKDLEDPTLQASCDDRPLGAFYRVDPTRLDDMQSAITELHAIVASSMIHDGWSNPAQETIKGETMHVIRRRPTDQVRGGHAFALVGYNSVGFLVQNSWGKDWGKGGYATLPYEEWLESAYDAWVARPGVPHTPLARTQRHVVSQGGLSREQGPDLDRLRPHVVNLGNQGRLSTNGRFTSSTAQLQSIITSMADHHKAWGAGDVVVFAHGGLVSEDAGLDIAQRQLHWWLNNHVYPVFITWETGPMEVIEDQLGDAVHRLVPFGAGVNIIEGVDRLIEGVAHRTLAWAWDEMKENAQAATAPLTKAGNPAGASFFLDLLRQYIGTQPNVRVHLVGHSAGTILLTNLLSRCREYKLPLASIAFLAAAVTYDEFAKKALPHLGSTPLSNFMMSDQRELDDNCLGVYHKSLLYLVSRGFERPKHHEVPLVGMARFSNNPLANGKALGAYASIITAPAGAADDAWCDAKAHGDFDDDPDTMTSVLLRIKNLTDASKVERFAPNTPLKPVAVGVPLTKPAASPSVGRPAGPGLLSARGPSNALQRAAKRKGRPPGKQPHDAGRR